MMPTLFLSWASVDASNASGKPRAIPANAVSRMNDLRLPFMNDVFMLLKE
jgi:hypothetical protein